MTDENKCLIIAEAGVNHNGRLDLALRLCDAVKEAGADVVKFQTWITEKLITRNVAMAEYQESNTGVTESQFDMLKRLELSFDDFRKIKKHCDDIGIVFASTADEPESLDFLVELGIPFIKVGSGDIGNVSFLEYMGSKGLPIILSTGMSSLADVKASLKALEKGGAKDITVLHCTTNYPCPYDEVNLKAMLTLEREFHYPVGYSDHTMGTEVSVAAVALGATVIEKHFTIDRNMEGPDHIASTEPDEFKYMVDQIRNIERALGDGIKQATASEKKIKGVITKRIVAACRIEAGETFSNDNICVKRSGEGKLASYWNEIIGLKASKTYEADEGVL